MGVAIGLGARLVVWIFLKIVLATTKTGQLAAVGKSLRTLELRIRDLAKRLGVEVTGGDGTPISTPRFVDEDDDDVFEVLPLAVA